LRAAILTLLLVLGAPGLVLAQVYRWTDAEGTIHYTTDAATIPPTFRGNVRTIDTPTPGPVMVPAPAPAGVVVPYTGGPVIVDASLNGVALRLLLDTGADRTLISPEAMSRAGFDASGGTPVQIRGVTGEAQAVLVSVPRLDLAGTQVGPVAVIVHRLAAAGADGLLGRDVLDAFTVTVDSASRRATLVPR
jgi:hypothetical protein